MRVSRSIGLVILIAIISVSTTPLLSAPSLSPEAPSVSVLTPAILTISPTAGIQTGGTRVTIFGDAFQAPVRVFFGTAEAQVVSVTLDQIIVISPPSATTGPVEVRVTNFDSATTTTTSERAFVYRVPAMIMAAGPAGGSDRGGTTLTIDGAAFSDPVFVTVAGAPAEVLSLSPTRISVVTSERIDDHCSNVTGPIVVTEVDTQEELVGPDFTYLVSRPAIVSIEPAVAHPGDAVRIRVSGVAAPAEFQIAGYLLKPVNTLVNPDGTTTFVLTIPQNFELPEGSCVEDGVERARPRPFRAHVMYSNPRTTCTDAVVFGLTITPPADSGCRTHASPHNRDLSP